MRQRPWLWYLAGFTLLCAMLEGLIDGLPTWFIQLVGALSIISPATIGLAGVMAMRSTPSAPDDDPRTA